MIKNIVSSVGIALALATAAQAGTPDKTISQPVTTTDFGTGSYVGLQGGFNADQEVFNNGVTSTKGNVGGFGGLKAGYVFDTKGLVRPALEFDGFYNGFSQNAFIEGTKVGKNDYDTGAYLVNALAKFNLGAFQPYVGPGIGGYTESGNNTPDKTSWAWQIVAGADYYFTHNMSVFAEYKWLNYMEASSFTGNDRLGQQLAGAGVRFHF